MIDSSELVKVVFKELVKKQAELKKELEEQRDLGLALAALESRAGELKDQLRILADMPVPKDLLDFYVESGGRVWVSKLRGFEEGDRFEIIHRARILNSSPSFSPSTIPGLPTGAYKFLLLMIPQDILEELKYKDREYWEDEYGESWSLRDC